MKALITGSGGLIGSECVRQLSAAGWDVIGIDNDMRREFFGEQGTTRAVVHDLQSTLPRYRHLSIDIRDRRNSSFTPPRSPRTTKPRLSLMTISTSTRWAP
jgi:nucleoside-diphosphate-sugar epimerase